MNTDTVVLVHVLITVFIGRNVFHGIQGISVIITAVIVYRWVQEERRRLYKVNKNTRNKFTPFLNLKCLFRLYNNFSMVLPWYCYGAVFCIVTLETIQ